MADAVLPDNEVSIDVSQKSLPFLQLMKDLVMISKFPAPGTADEKDAFERRLGAAVLDSVHVFFKNSRLAPAHIPVTLQHLGVALLDLNKGTQNRIFLKPPNVSKAPDPTQFWLMRAEIAALLKLLIEQGYEKKEPAAARIYKPLERSLGRLTYRAPDARGRKDRPAKVPKPAKLISNWLKTFETASASTKTEAGSFGDVNFMALERFKRQYAGLTSDWMNVAQRERAVWINTRIATLKMKLDNFRL